VNRSCFLSCAACRTPHNPWDTRTPRCVGRVRDRAMFSLVCTLSSPTSAEDRSPLFRRFTGTTVQSDPSRPCMAAVRRSAFAARSRSGGPETAWRSPGSRACRFSACHGSLTTPGRRTTRVSRSPACCLPPQRTGSAPGREFSKLNRRARRCPCLRFRRHLAMPPARLRVRMESLAPFLQGSCIPCNMPVYPGAPSDFLLPPCSSAPPLLCMPFRPYALTSRRNSSTTPRYSAISASPMTRERQSRPVSEMKRPRFMPKRNRALCRSGLALRVAR